MGAAGAGTAGTVGSAGHEHESSTQAENRPVKPRMVDKRRVRRGNIDQKTLQRVTSRTRLESRDRLLFHWFLPDRRAHPCEGSQHYHYRNQSISPILKVVKRRHTPEAAFARHTVVETDPMIPKIRYTRSHGFTLMEVMFALGIFSVMILMFSSVFPSVLRGSHSGASYAQACSSRTAQDRPMPRTRLRQGLQPDRRGGQFTRLTRELQTRRRRRCRTQADFQPIPSPTLSRMLMVSARAPCRQAPQGIVTIGPPAGTSWTPTGSLVQVTVTITWPIKSLITGQSTYNGKVQTHTLLMNAS